jgi:hypothetical protein
VKDEWSEESVEFTGCGHQTKRQMVRLASNYITHYAQAYHSLIIISRTVIIWPGLSLALPTLHS